MKKISVFKVICWFIVAFIASLLLDTVAYNILNKFIGGLYDHTVIYNIILLSASSAYGFYVALFGFALASKLESPNLHKALIGVGIVFLLMGIIDKILLLVNGIFNLEVSVIVSGLYYLLYGLALDSMESKPDTAKQDESEQNSNNNYNSSTGYSNNSNSGNTWQEEKKKAEQTKKTEQTQKRRNTKFTGDIEEYLIDVAEDESSPENEKYISHLMEENYALTREHATAFMGIVILNGSNGKSEALRFFDMMVNKWISETKVKNGDPLTNQMMLMYEVTFLCGALYHKKVVTKSEKEGLSIEYSSRIKEELIAYRKQKSEEERVREEYRRQQEQERQQEYEQQQYYSSYQSNDDSQNVSAYFNNCTSREQVEKTYRNLCKVYHPDQLTGDEETFLNITEEYEFLMNTMRE